MSGLRYALIVLLVLAALPSSLYAVGMGGMGGMGSVATMANKILIQTENVGAVEFSHSIHGSRCNECHPRLFKKQRNSNHVTMKAMEQGKSCGACHNGKKAFSVTANCVVCHAGEIVYKEEDLGNVLFSHEVHIDMFGCEDCHPDLFRAKQGANKATMEDMENGESCGACHDGATAFNVAEDCEACHAM